MTGRLSTGNCDMNNKPIYEGDVVQSRFGPCLIIYKDKRFYAERISDKCQYDIADLDFKYTEVVGSIYYNRYILDMVQDSFAMWQHYFLKDLKTVFRTYRQMRIDESVYTKTRMDYDESKFFNKMSIFACDLDEVEAHSLKLLAQNSLYKQALDEIEKYTKNQLDEFNNDVYGMDKSAIKYILDIINKI